MTTRELVRHMQTAQPFQPFLVKLADGRTFLVRHPELVSCSMNGREMFLRDEEGLHLVEMLLVAELAAAPERLVSDGNGQSGP
jgi:hypothetical protein